MCVCRAPDNLVRVYRVRRHVFWLLTHQSLLVHWLSMHRRPAKEAKGQVHRMPYPWYIAIAIASEELNSLQMRWSSSTSAVGSKDDCRVSSAYARNDRTYRTDFIIYRFTLLLLLRSPA